MPLHPTPSLTEVDQRVLGEVDAMRRDLRHHVAQRPGKWLGGLRKYLTADAVSASNTIEGVHVATVDVLDLAAGETDVDVDEESKADTLSYQHMMTYVRSLHDTPDFSYDKGLLNGLHWMLQGHRHTPVKPAGQWRRKPVYVTDARDPSIAAYTGPDAATVPGLMAELVEWLNGGDLGAHPLVRAAMAHLHLVSIHPWMDGNGRMSRTLQTLVIAREGVIAPEFCSIEGWLGRPGNTWEYYACLQARGSVYAPHLPVPDWISFNLRAHHEQIQTVRSRFDRSARVWSMLADECAGLGLDERCVTALHEVAMIGRVRRTGYQNAEQISLQQAQRDLRDLGAAGVLEAKGKTKGRVYTPGPRFPAEVLEEARRPLPVKNPYTGR